MNQTTRAALQDLQNQFRSLEDNYQIRDTGTVTYRTAMIGLQGVIDQPDDAATTVVQTIVADTELATLGIKVDGLGMNLTQRMTQVEAAVISLVNKTIPETPPATLPAA